MAATAALALPVLRAPWRLPEVLTGDLVIVEPASLPYGGEHRGVHGYVALMRRIGALLALLPGG
jgi:hypothetical protein